MEISIQYLEQQIANLKRQRDQLLADANACSGAIQAHEAILERRRMPEPEKAKDVTPKKPPEKKKEN